MTLTRFSLLAVALLAPAALPAAATADAAACFEAGATGSLALGDGETVACGGKPTDLDGSVHEGMDCADCHGEATPDGDTFADRAELRRKLGATCQGCHDFEGVHAAMVGETAKVSCAECHGGHAVKPAAEAKEAGCASCHGQPIEKRFPSGEVKSLEIAEDHLAGSVHEGMDCTDCHAAMAGDEHPVSKAKTARAARIESAEMCKECHDDMYARMLEGVHYEWIKKGEEKAPVCADCHGTHDIQAGKADKLASAKRCRTCHEDTYDEYVASVHGKSLIEKKNEDVPVCSDCHKSHEIADPRKPGFAVATPEICSDCHANEELMAKYGLTTAVLDTYLADFHGVTRNFYKMQGGEPEQRIGTCTACHGIHDITRTRGDDAAVMKSKLVSRCQRCHEGATADFPDAWISHYEPSPKRAAIVWAVELGYKILIPFMIIGLLVQVFMHVYRYTVIRNRK